MNRSFNRLLVRPSARRRWELVIIASSERSCTGCIAYKGYSSANTLATPDGFHEEKQWHTVTLSRPGLPARIRGVPIMPKSITTTSASSANPTGFIHQRDWERPSRPHSGSTHARTRTGLDVLALPQERWLHPSQLLTLTEPFQDTVRGNYVTGTKIPPGVACGGKAEPDGER